MAASGRQRIHEQQQLRGTRGERHESEPDDLPRREPAGRQRPRRCAMHAAIGRRFEPLVERAGARGDQCRAEHRVPEHPGVDAARRRQMGRDDHRHQLEHHDSRLGELDEVANAREPTEAIDCPGAGTGAGVGGDPRHVATPMFDVEMRVAESELAGSDRHAVKRQRTATSPTVSEPIATCAVIMCVCSQPSA